MSPDPKPVNFPDAARRALANALRQKVKGEVRFDDGSRSLYATDGSNYRQVPLGVVIPTDKEDVMETVAVCHAHEAPVLSRGGGTALAGQSCNVAVVMDFSKRLNQLLHIDPDRRLARVQPGCVLDTLRDAAEKYHLTFAPDPSTHAQNSLGGMIGNNSCGVRSIMAGRTADNVNRLEVLTYDGQRFWVGPTSEDELEAIIREGGRRGEIYAGMKALRDKYAEQMRARYHPIPRRVSGYSIDMLLPEKGFNVARALVGSEGTLVTVLEAELNLVHSPPERNLLVLGYPDFYQSADHVPEIMEYGPIGLEAIDGYLVKLLKESGGLEEGRQMLPEGGGWLMVEFGGETKDEADDKARRLMARLKKDKISPSTVLFDREEGAKIWEVRETGLGLTAYTPHDPDAPPSWEGWEDSAVPPDRLGRYLREFQTLLNKYDYHTALYGHFGEGCVHARINFDLQSEAGVKKYKSFAYEAADLVLSHDGSLSGEHGDGQSRAELLPKMYGEELIQAFREFKSIWDPDWKMNPGKVIDAYRMDQNLRMLNYHPSKMKTAFAYTTEGDFPRAAKRCVGIGKCRRQSGIVMCPSYRGTMEEMHSTRGRSRLLFEMLYSDNPSIKPWQSEAVHEALDLCLACKGCKKDCPVSVDMATYKAEFYYHYYKHKLRPRTAYALGLIYWWSRLASTAPRLANVVTQTPGLAHLAKSIGGIAPERRLPKFATQTFRAWFKRRGVQNIGSPKVMLFPDTFNNYFQPWILKSSVKVLEHAGFQVLIPSRPLCCGRPLYPEGMLDLSRHLLKQIMNELGKDSIPVVGLEPACMGTFKDELVELFPKDARAQSLKERSFILSEFLEQQDGYTPPKLKRQALVHIHCIHHGVLGESAEQSLLSKMGLEIESPGKGCCGMAGSFGFERGEKYNLSMKIGEGMLLPAVRNADQDTLIIADGFSCREQIAQTTSRKALHLAEVMDMALPK